MCPYGHRGFESHPLRQNCFIHTVVNDAIDEPEGETIVVTALHDREALAWATVTVRDGVAVASGVYLARLVYPGGVQTRQLLLVK